MKRKIFNLFLIILMAFVFSPIVGYAETVVKPDGSEWLVNESGNHVWYMLTENTPATDPVSYRLIIGGSGEMPDWIDSAYLDKPRSFLNVPWRDNETHFLKNITKIEIKEGITKIGNYSFSLSNYKTVRETETSPDAFPVVDISTIKEVILPESLESIGNNAFRFNTTLLKIEFPSKLTTIDYSAFQGCGLTNLVLPEGLKSIGKVAFTNNANLEEITLPSKLESIGQQAFAGCVKIKTIVSYNKKAPELEANVFKNVDFEKLNLIIPSSSIESYKTNWSIDETIVTINYIYNIEFNTNGGTNIDSVRVRANNKLTKPTDPTKDNYVFDGWYSDEKLNEQFDFNTNITKDITLYAKWREVESFSYTFINGDNQELEIGNIKSFILKIDGNYSLFESITIGDLDLTKNDDYEISEGSTVITFTDKGIAKLNTLEKGEYEILVKYSNGEEVKGKLLMNNLDNQEIEENPKTGDKVVSYLIIGSLSLISLAGCCLYLNRKRFN